MPASLLSGWKGAGSMLLSLGAITGGGLLGAPVQRLQEPTPVLLRSMAVLAGLHAALAWASAAAACRPMHPAACLCPLNPHTPAPQAPALTCRAPSRCCRRWQCWA